MYLRTADYSTKKSCGIYEIESDSGRHSYKIFAGDKDLQLYLKKNKGKICKDINLFSLSRNTRNMQTHK